MHDRFYAWLLLGWMVLSPAGAADVPPAVSSESRIRREVERLLPGLGADDLMTRSDSRTRLIELGPQILPYLPDLATVKDAAEREAIRRLANALERLHARESLLPSAVSVDEASISLGTLLQRVSQQTGNRFDLSNLDSQVIDSKHSIRLQNATFWAAIGEIDRVGQLQPATCTAEGLQFEKTTSENGVVGQAISLDGAFRVEAGPVIRRPVVGQAGRDLIRIPITCLSEPRLRPLLATFAIREFRTGSPSIGRCNPFDPQAQLELSFGTADRAIRWSLDYVVDSAADVMQLDVAGQVQVLLAAGEMPLVFPSLPECQGAERSRGGLSVRIHSVEELTSNDGLRSAIVAVDVVYDRGGPGFESHQTWSLHNDVRLTTRDEGAADLLPTGGMTTERSADGALRLKYRFMGLEQPFANYRFVYRAPVSVASHAVAIDVKRLPVPAATKP